MKKKITFTLIGFVALLLNACEPEFDHEFIIQDVTQRDLTIVMSGDYARDANNQGCYDLNNRFESHSLNYSFRFGGVGCTDRKALEYWIAHDILGDSVQVIIDSTVVVTWYPTDTSAINSPYNFHSPNYTYYEHSVFSRCDATYNVYMWNLIPE